MTRNASPVNMKEPAHINPDAVSSPDRRRFLLQGSSLLLSASAGLIFPPGVLANDFWEQPRSLYLRRAGTDETIRETYWAHGKLVEPGYKSICHLLRDRRAGVSTEMSPRLLDILSGIQGWFKAFGQDRMIVVTSGYRTKKSNENIEGAAKNSRHMTGGAADITIPDVPSDYLAKLGLYLQGGGVGWYPSRHFVHVDDWKQRFWKG